mmetsp:Transcript_26420/g.26670  ORF Transcript_26420/g.26670 Transcript_26420/m.26670 type:complete len:211 (+) Transcript_26420:111-743(+)|eukprot:CAMPEP_0182420836 /NCGR_PEP_ID=MMETSP1167-20130531/5924_1 /TAXON_ID=2988 /ORGANISM="Mallomonas Sp, Strain CCMP3275" /LENGTH=210 /DNA_ID=CAMNT_0024597331 /DNA_START=43 /DNA_END=675 /DNA_ORIENTATION=+
MTSTPDLTDEQLRALYAWIDAIPLSRPKRNITRDFSDGVMLAEVVAAYFPQLVELHNYSPASSVQAKIYNFDTLNQKVLKRFGYQLTRSSIEDIVNCRPGAIESVLNTLQFKMSKYKEKKSGNESAEDKDSPRSSPGSSAIVKKNVSPGALNARGRGGGVTPTVDEEIILEKEQKIRELQETVEILELKIVKLEQLVRLKDNKISKLQQK